MSSVESLQGSEPLDDLLTNTSSQEPKPSFEQGQLIDGKFCVKKKINEGGFGVIYEVTDLAMPSARYAMKLALVKDSETDQSVKMEIGLLRRLSKQSICFPRFHKSGMIDGYRYLVMDLLGPSLADIQSYMQDEKFSIGTTIRIGLQIIDAIEKMHECFFIHRDVKPGNMAVGLRDHRQIYLFDFGLARRFVKKDPETDILEFRPERPKAPFRGTYHYCSLHQHQYKDACRRDDLWALMFTLIEFISGILPWEHEKEKKKIEKMKQDTPLSVLLQDCPLMFEALMNYLDTLEFKSEPSYNFFRQAFKLSLSEYNVDEAEPYDWELYDDIDYSSHEYSDYSSSQVTESGTSLLTEQSGSLNSRSTATRSGTTFTCTRTATTFDSRSNPSGDNTTTASNASTGSTLKTNFSSIFTTDLSSVSSSSM